MEQYLNSLLRVYTQANPLSKEIKLARRTKAVSLVKKELEGPSREIKEKDREFIVSSYEVAEKI